ncbi:MAG: tRNA (adenosine(37)-N6)-dimethylallyltransferase MiaA [Gammaproteobacteria bacterium]|uniref:tRNA dimethylallyltransferase n=1 Tax=Candidatus Thiopontia autotrophica TaxID=2841688 RepID=A0A8J6PAP7_9GAMM|nr:tRNA (adenosine(37)-N6)-dimethylallyltransferase MiaA [Candidatus Thiopontia autotrophica]
MGSFSVGSSAGSSAEPLVFLTGPTAAGKTDLAVELVENYPFEIISVDSALVYRGMDIGTAKPGSETLRRAPHRLIDIVDPAEPYSAARFRDDALQEIEEIRANGNIPLLVGGTMLYFRALQFGLSVLPESDRSVRLEIEKDIKDKGIERIYKQLSDIDTVAAARINRNDPQRIIRALEVYRISGVPMSELQQQKKREGLNPDALLMVAISPDDRSLLHKRIEQRLSIMMESGFIEEVERLKRRRDLSLDTPSMRSVGYRQVWEYLDGVMDREEMLYRAVVATRQLAKRQLTWLRNWPTDIKWMEPEGNGMAEYIFNNVRNR